MGLTHGGDIYKEGYKYGVNIYMEERTYGKTYTRRVVYTHDGTYTRRDTYTEEIDT